MNIAIFPTEIAPFTEVKFEILIFEKRRKCKGIVQPSPHPLLGCVLVEFEVYVEPEFDTPLVGDDRIYRGMTQLLTSQVTPCHRIEQREEPARIQLSLLDGFELTPENSTPIKRVLGGNKIPKTRDQHTTPAHPKDHACGWIEFHKIKRERKNGDVWESDQPWLHWEEPGGRKRSKYIPKAKYAEVNQFVYGLQKPIDETLKLLEKK